MRKQLLPPLSALDADNFDKFTKSDRVVVVGFVEDSESDEYAVLDTLAKELRDEFTFGVVADKDLAKEQGVTAPGVVVYKQFDDGKDVFEEEITAKDLRTFIKASSVPVLDEISGANYAMYAQTGLPFGFAFFDSEETRKELEKQLYPVAKAHKGAINVVLIDANKFASQADHLNLEHKWPAFAIQKQANLDKFPFSQDEEITEESINAFVKDFIADKLEPSYKSEPIPESNDGNVFVLVSKQFNEVVFDKSKDVLVEAYAPWCHHCRSLVPVYEKLGSILKHNKNLIISKMDAIANDVPSSEAALQIYGFPTIVLVSGKNNAIIEYKGNRSLESLVEFLKENAAYEITYNKSDLDVKEEEDEDEIEEDEDEQAAKEDTEEVKAEEDDKYEEDTKVDAKSKADAEEVTDEEPKTDAAHEEL
ncbi:protein disulfide-isomerase precursor [Coemansia guatemalensis]|uniref:Protein disulfide-isomerase n=1 Tax=Coemansia guatemalensis TaxID=2761395 RepID=A0A9W8LQW4_9FUNG|nr:protein disulfide-isomerase precursor [Coemansia guatemalensis]